MPGGKTTYQIPYGRVIHIPNGWSRILPVEEAKYTIRSLIIGEMTNTKKMALRETSLRRAVVMRGLLETSNGYK